MNARLVKWKPASRNWKQKKEKQSSGMPAQRSRFLFVIFIVINRGETSKDESLSLFSLLQFLVHRHLGVPSTSIIFRPLYLVRQCLWCKSAQVSVVMSRQLLWLWLSRPESASSAPEAISRPESRLWLWSAPVPKQQQSRQHPRINWFAGLQLQDAAVAPPLFMGSVK
uniref:Uncharacterized protein n=1 Tax=Ditylenchus dipsaci TaxID=166011 RepID=A0A915ESA0_9BILA